MNTISPIVVSIWSLASVLCFLLSGVVMNIIKKSLMALGVVCIGFITIAIFLETESTNFQQENTKFVTKFMQDFSSDWSMDKVSRKVGYHMVEQSQTENGRLTLRNFSSLGDLKSIDNLELVDHIYYFSSRPNVGIFSFNATFEYGIATVQLVIEDTTEGVKVQVMNVDPKYIETSQLSKDVRV